MRIETDSQIAGDRSCAGNIESCQRIGFADPDTSGVDERIFSGSSGEVDKGGGGGDGTDIDRVCDL